MGNKNKSEGNVLMFVCYSLVTVGHQENLGTMAEVGVSATHHLMH